MSHHVDDNRVWSYDTRTGEKRRVKPQVLRYSKYLRMTPSERARQVQISEPHSFEPDVITEPVNTPDPTPHD